MKIGAIRSMAVDSPFLTFDCQSVRFLMLVCHRINAYFRYICISKVNSQEFHRSLSKLVANASINSIIRDGDHAHLRSILSKYSAELGIRNTTKIIDVFTRAYDILSKNYRSEYIYKNTLLNKQLLGKYSLNTATILNEFRVGLAKADLVLLNGTSVAYEIKTELDSPERLAHQVHNYQKVFANTVIVTHHSISSKYAALLPKHVGVLALNSRNQLSCIRDPKESLKELDPVVMMKSLRKSEYTRIIKTFYGRTPEVPNMLYFKECLALFTRIPKQPLHEMMVTELKRRTINEQADFLSSRTPAELRHVCFCLDFKKSEYQALHNFLNQRACTYLT